MSLMRRRHVLHCFKMEPSPHSHMRKLRLFWRDSDDSDANLEPSYWPSRRPGGDRVNGERRDNIKADRCCVIASMAAPCRSLQPIARREPCGKRARRC